MPKVLKCPKCGQNARRLFAQVSSPKAEGGTGRSTNVTVAAVLCADVSAEKVGSRLVGTYSVPKGRCGIVPLSLPSFRAGQRQRWAETAREHPEWKAQKPKAAAKPKAPRKTSPKAPRSPASASAAPTAAEESSKSPAGA